MAVRAPTYGEAALDERPESRGRELREESFVQRRESDGAKSRRHEDRPEGDSVRVRKFTRARRPETEHQDRPMEAIYTEREVRAPAQLWRGRDPKRRDLEPVAVGTDGCEDDHRPRRRRGEAAERVEALAADRARDARA